LPIHKYDESIYQADNLICVNATAIAEGDAEIEVSIPNRSIKTTVELNHLIFFLDNNNLYPTIAICAPYIFILAICAQQCFITSSKNFIQIRI